MIDAIIVGAVVLVALVAAVVMAKEKWDDAISSGPAWTNLVPSVPEDEPKQQPAEPVRYKMPRSAAFERIDSLGEYFSEEGNQRGSAAMREAGLAMFDSGESILGPQQVVE
jgi:hypothetical protein